MCIYICMHSSYLKREHFLSRFFRINFFVGTIIITAIMINTATASTFSGKRPLVVEDGAHRIVIDLPADLPTRHRFHQRLLRRCRRIRPLPTPLAPIPIMPFGLFQHILIFFRLLCLLLVLRLVLEDLQMQIVLVHFVEYGLLERHLRRTAEQRINFGLECRRNLLLPIAEGKANFDRDDGRQAFFLVGFVRKDDVLSLLRFGIRLFQFRCDLGELLMRRSWRLAC
mmetsp:Transcript_27238/g.76511  ORF Transcript_27238/g.76511 Transcript_27238/m.76511 type:complete len:226 (-) Transcript_27238:129-806(-)